MKPHPIVILILLVLLASCGGAPTLTPTAISAVCSKPQSHRTTPRAVAVAVVPGDAARGETLFNRTVMGKNAAPGCINCHSLAPGVTLVGPSLASIGARPDATADYVRESIIAPDAVIAVGFTVGSMYPNYAAELTPQELADLTEFMLTLR